jgi:hypothetical protein
MKHTNPKLGLEIPRFNKEFGKTLDVTCHKFINHLLDKKDTKGVTFSMG